MSCCLSLTDFKSLHLYIVPSIVSFQARDGELCQTDRSNNKNSENLKQILSNINL